MALGTVLGALMNGPGFSDNGGQEDSPAFILLFQRYENGYFMVYPRPSKQALCARR